MTSVIPEADLHQLRELIARLYGEDIAQDSMVRILSREYRENWFKKEMRWARKQWKLEEMRLRCVEPFDEETFHRTDDTDRILAWIDLRKGCRTKPTFLRLALIETGDRPVPHTFTVLRLRQRSKQG